MGAEGWKELWGEVSVGCESGGGGQTCLRT